jgi:L-iditol 2-dehydrogenase
VAGICGSDLHYFTHGGLGSRPAALPMSLGHEAAGTVVGSMYGSGFEEGDRVAIEPALCCGQCYYCRYGLPNLCPKTEFIGANSSGAFSEFLLVDERQLVKIDLVVSFEQAAMLEPFGVALHAVRLAGLEPGQSVAVFGAGPIGLSLVMAAQLSGAAEVYVIDPIEHRCNVAVDLLKVQHSIPCGAVNALQYVKAMTEGGVDAAFDAAGMQQSVHDCFDVVRPGGKVVLVGIPTYEFLHYNPHVARTKELTIFNVRRSRHTLEESLRLLRSRHLPLANLVTHRWPMDSIQEAFETAAEYRDGIVKGVIANGG